MQTQILARAPQARCYKCGTADVAGVCHHCGRPICATHCPVLTDGTEKRQSMEFVGLGLRDTKCGEVPTHCESCDHIVRAQNPLLILIGVLVAVVGMLLLMTDNIGLGLISALVGGSLIVSGVLVNLYRAREAQRVWPFLPLLPRFDRVQLLEKLGGEIHLDADGHYIVSTKPVEGTLRITSSLGRPELDRLQQYRKRHHLTDGDDVSFHIGFAVFKGPVGLKFGDDYVQTVHSKAVIPLVSQVSKQPFFQGTDSHGSGEWHISHGYSLLAAPDKTFLPVSLVPSLVQEAAQRALEIELQWGELDINAVEPTITRIDLLKLQVPIEWGEVESINDSALVEITPDSENSNNTVRTITWRRPSLTDKERKERRRTFSIRFEKSVELTSMVRGHVELSFKGTFSGVKDVDLYYPSGKHREEEIAVVRTQVTTDFKLSLSGLRYQDVRIVPDPKKDGDRQDTVIFEGVIPDHYTVIALTNAMSNQGFYVKRVIENPPRTGGRANVVNRFWDIAGRRYDDVYPIDFHLIVTGEEVYSGEIRAQAGTTRVSLTVQGAYANPEMEEQIENVWEQLDGLIGETLKQLPKAIPVTGLREDVSRPTQASVVTPQGSANQTERIAALRKRLDQLMEALIAGRVSEQTYLQLKSDVEEEIRILHSNA